MWKVVDTLNTLGGLYESLGSNENIERFSVRTVKEYRELLEFLIRLGVSARVSRAVSRAARVQNALRELSKGSDNTTRVSCAIKTLGPGWPASSCGYS